MRTYSDILHEYSDIKIPYSHLLETKEWYDKRNLIITRENNICQQCSKPCVDDYVFFKPVVYQFFEVEESVIDPYTGEFLGTYPKQAARQIVQTDPHFAHVHHTYYVLSRLPWEYPNEDLMLLCHKCHTHLHQIQNINVFRTESKLETVNLMLCNRCEGTGHLPEYNHVQNGVCFRCRGACFEEWT